MIWMTRIMSYSTMISWLWPVCTQGRLCRWSCTGRGSNIYSLSRKMASLGVTRRLFLISSGKSTIWRSSPWNREGRLTSSIISLSTRRRGRGWMLRMWISSLWIFASFRGRGGRRLLRHRKSGRSSMRWCLGRLNKKGNEKLMFGKTSLSIRKSSTKTNMTSKTFLN